MGILTGLCQTGLREILEKKTEEEEVRKCQSSGNKIWEVKGRVPKKRGHRRKETSGGGTTRWGFLLSTPKRSYVEAT